MNKYNFGSIKVADSTSPVFSGTSRFILVQFYKYRIAKIIIVCI